MLADYIKEQRRKQLEEQRKLFIDADENRRDGETLEQAAQRLQRERSTRK